MPRPIATACQLYKLASPRRRCRPKSGRMVAFSHVDFVRNQRGRVLGAAPSACDSCFASVLGACATAGPCFASVPLV
jgi:hypothetical protein